MAFTIDTHVPLTPARSAPSAKWNQALEAIGMMVPLSTDSFLLPFSDFKKGNAGGNYMHQIAAKKGYRITTRKEHNADGTYIGQRIWRLE